MGRTPAALAATVFVAVAVAAAAASPTSRSGGGRGGGKAVRLTAFKYVPCGYGYQPGFAMGYHDHIMTGGGGVAGGGAAATANTNNNNANNNVNNNHITIQMPPASRRAAAEAATPAADRYRAGYAAGRAFGVHYDGRLAGAVPNDAGGDGANGADDADAADEGGSRGGGDGDGTSVRLPAAVVRAAGVVERRGWCWVKVAWTQPVRSRA